MVLSTKVAQMRLTTCVYIVYYTSDIFWRVKTTSGEMFTSWGYMVTFCESLTFFWGNGWIFITFMGLLSLKVGTWTPKNLGRSLTLYMVIAMIQTTPGTPTLPLERKKKCSFWTFPILHCSLTALTHFFIFELVRWLKILWGEVLMSCG